MSDVMIVSDSANPDRTAALTAPVADPSTQEAPAATPAPEAPQPVLELGEIAAPQVFEPDESIPELPAAPEPEAEPEEVDPVAARDARIAELEAALEAAKKPAEAPKAPEATTLPAPAAEPVLEAPVASQVDSDLSLAELLADPVGFVQKANAKAAEEARRAAQETQRRAEKATADLVALVPDAAEIHKDPAFRAWINQSEFRKQRFANVNKSLDPADYADLMSTFKEVKASKNQNTPQADAEAVQTALNSSGDSASPEAPEHPRYSQKALINLKNTNPAEYERRSAEILKAYANGWVIADLT